MSNLGSNEAEEATQDKVDEIRRCLLTVSQVQHYSGRIAELRTAMQDLELAGTPEQISLNIGLFHLFKGKIETFEELLEDHMAASNIEAKPQN